MYGLIVLPHPGQSLRQIMDALDNVLWHFGFFPQLQCLLEIGEGVLVFALGKIDAADIVQADCLQTFIADIALELQGFLIHS